jgi:hypothetical protein
MSFRRDRDKTLEWHKWVEANQDRLIAIGIPREVWEDRAVWQRFLWHGYHSDELNWRMFRFSMDDLEVERLKLLHQFFSDEGFSPGCQGSTVWDALQRQFAQPDKEGSTDTEHP